MQARSKLLTVNFEEKTRPGSKLLPHSAPPHLPDKRHTHGYTRASKFDTICTICNVNVPNPFIISVKTPGSLSIRHHSSAILLYTALLGRTSSNKQISQYSVQCRNKSKSQEYKGMYSCYGLNFIHRDTHNSDIAQASVYMCHHYIPSSGHFCHSAVPSPSPR